MSNAQYVQIVCNMISTIRKPLVVWTLDAMVEFRFLPVNGECFLE